MIVNYDNCSFEEEALIVYSGQEFFKKKFTLNLDSVKELIKKYKVIRYTTSAFERMKFGSELTKRSVKPNLFENTSQVADFIKNQIKSKL